MPERALDFESQMHWECYEFANRLLVDFIWFNCSGKALTSFPLLFAWSVCSSHTPASGLLHVMFPLSQHLSPQITPWLAPVFHIVICLQITLLDTFQPCSFSPCPAFFSSQHLILFYIQGGQK